MQPVEAQEPWYRDAWLWVWLVVGLVARSLPLIAFGEGGCLRDECAYVTLSKDIVAGLGLREFDDWLWAPGYPYYLSVFERLGDVGLAKRLQVVLASATGALLYGLARPLGGRRVARHVAFWHAVHPTIVFFASTFWAESLTSLALVAGVASVPWVRTGPPARGLALGAAMAITALLRGAGAGFFPVLLAAVLWPASEAWKDAVRARVAHVAAACIGFAALVGPYSVQATHRHGGFVLTDATVGQVAWIGNNDFPVFTYDVGNGLVSESAIDRHTANGRPHCPASLPTAAWNTCEVQNAAAWIRRNPAEFARRVPVRWAQLLNPNSFLTRNLRMGRWTGVPWWLKESLVVVTIAGSLLTLWGGTVGAAARARGPVGVAIVGAAVFQLAMIAGLFGMTRFRVPVETLWLVWLGWFTADPRGTWRALRASPARMATAVAVLAALVPLVLTHLLSGFPLFYR